MDETTLWRLHGAFQFGKLRSEPLPPPRARSVFLPILAPLGARSLSPRPQAPLPSHGPMTGSLCQLWAGGGCHVTVSCDRPGRHSDLEQEQPASRGRKSHDQLRSSPRRQTRDYSIPPQQAPPQIASQRQSSIRFRPVGFRRLRFIIRVCCRAVVVETV